MKLNSNLISAPGLFLLGTVMLGCQATSKPSTQYPPSDYGRLAPSGSAHVIILPGIAGGGHPDPRALLGVINGKAGLSAQIWDWTAIYPTGSQLKDLNDDRRNKARATVLATRIAELRASGDRTPLVLVGLSGGAKIAYFACASGMIATSEFDKIILLSGASNTIQPAHRMVACSKHGVFNYASAIDEYLIFVPFAIGLNGYNPIPAGVMQLRWGSRMATLGNNGKHLNCLDEPFCSKCVLPLMGPGPRDWPPECRKLGV